MSDTIEEDPLIEYNNTNKENAVQEFVSSVFISMAETSPTMDKFSIWLLAGTGATGAFLIAQASSVLPHLTTFGFKVSMALLISSAVFGVIAKLSSIRCETQTHMMSKFPERLEPVFEKHREAAEEIQEFASKRGMKIETGFKLSDVVDEFLKPFPSWVQWIVRRKMKKESVYNRQAGYHIAVKAYFYQSIFTFTQVCLFLCFMTAGAYFVTNT